MLVVYAFSWEKISIIPEEKDMVVAYKVFNAENTALKTGLITLTNTGKGIPLGMFQSLKKKTFEYLDQYDASIVTMGKTLIDKIAAEL
ncbi:MAG: hypothetical protein ABIY51_09180 [Ferruginibacter sp.]